MARQDALEGGGKALERLRDPSLFAESGLFHRAAKASVKAAYRVLWRCTWRGPGRVPAEGPALLVANHPSYLDPLCIYVGSPRRIHWMAWKRLFAFPWMGKFIRRAGAFPVDSLGLDPGAVRTTVRRLRGGGIVGIFPEGGRSLPDGCLFPFLEAPFRIAVRLGVPVIPVTVNGSGSVWPRGALLPRIGGPIEVVFHLAVRPGRRTGAKAAAGDLARRAREAVLSAYQAPARILEASRAVPVLSPEEHPVVQSDRAGVPLLEWIAGRKSV